VREALKRLAAQKAPSTVTQLVLWRVAQGMDWETIEGLAKSWANPQEVALARRFIETLDGGSKSPREGFDPGTFRYSMSVDGAGEHAGLIAGLGKALEGRQVVGLTARSGVPVKPEGPGLACEISLTGIGAEARLDVRLAVTDGDASRWVPAGRAELSLTGADGKALEPGALADALAEKVLESTVRAEVAHGPRVKGKETFRITIRNGSPLVLNGLALGAAGADGAAAPSVVSGLCIPPRKSLTLPASAETVERLGLKKEARVIAADLSAL